MRKNEKSATQQRQVSSRSCLNYTLIKALLSQEIQMRVRDWALASKRGSKILSYVLQSYADLTNSGLLKILFGNKFLKQTRWQMLLTKPGFVL